MGTTSEKLTYLNTTKGKIKDSINLTGANITTEPFRQYSTKLEDAYVDIINNGTDTLYNNFPKVSGEGTSLTLNNTYQAPMRNNLKGNTSQTGTPTPSNPIPVNVVSGDNTITISNQGGTDTSTYSINLGTIEMCKIGTYQDQFKKATGKNLAPINLESETYNTLEITNNNNGTFTLLGNPTGSFGRDIATNLTLKAGTYTISANSMPSGLYIALDNEADTQLSNGTLSKTFTLASDTTYTSLGIWFTKNKDYDVTIQLQIEKSSSATEWQPKEGWYKEQQVGKVVLNGSETWAISSKTYYTNIALKRRSYSSDQGNMFSNLFVNTTATSSNNVLIGEMFEFWNATYGNTNVGFNYDNGVAGTDAFKIWLGTHNITLYYILATPTSEPIPSNLINQLEEFYQAQSKNNQTNISQINNDLGFIISASALKKG